MNAVKKRSAHFPIHKTCDIRQMKFVGQNNNIILTIKAKPL